MSGVVLVDGKPAEGVVVTFNPIEGMDTAQPTLTRGMTDADGKFSASTYEAGDGAPVGEYAITFQWGQLNKLTMAYGGDKFNGRYSKPETSPLQVTVEDGPLDLGKIELKTKN